jgi:hypothetical protein
LSATEPAVAQQLRHLPPELNEPLHSQPRNQRSAISRQLSVFTVFSYQR